MTRATPEWIGRTPDTPIPPRVKLTVDDILDRAMPEPNSGCWLWERGIQSPGYGCWPIGKGRHKKAHRVAYEIANGTIPRGMVVCHRCDNPYCVNPDHLFLGSQSDNMKDMWAKGRGKPLVVRRGDDHPQKKLSSDSVTAIRLDRRPIKEIAVAYGVSRQMIWRVRSGKNWT